MSKHTNTWKDFLAITKNWDGSDEGLEIIIKESEAAGFSLSHTPHEEGRLFFTKAMEMLNEAKGGRPFPIIFPSKASTLILNLKKKNFTLEDIKYVVELKSKEWRGTPVWPNFRWKTLFNESNFLNYIAQDGPGIKRTGKDALTEFAGSVRAAQGSIFDIGEEPA